MRKVAASLLGALVLLTAGSSHAQSDTATVAANACKAGVNAAINDNKVAKDANPAALCDNIGKVINPPPYPGPLIATVGIIPYKDTPGFYEGLRRVLKTQQKSGREVWVEFDNPALAPTLSALGRLNADTGTEAGLMTWISKSKQFGNQFCRATDKQSVKDSLATGGIQIFVSLFDGLIKKWNATRFYNPAKSYSVIAVYSSKPEDRMRLTRMRFVPKQYMAPNCAKLLQDKPPEDLSKAPVLGS